LKKKIYRAVEAGEKTRRCTETYSAFSTWQLKFLLFIFSKASFIWS
jgi:hypothetical protein